MSDTVAQIAAVPSARSLQKSHTHLFQHGHRLVRAHGHAPDDVTSRRTRARWYTTKTEPSYDDMAVKLRRVIIAARFRGPCPEQATPQETRAVLAAWAAAGT